MVLGDSFAGIEKTMQKLFSLAIFLFLLGACSTFQKSGEIQASPPTSPPTSPTIVPYTLTQEVANTLSPTSTRIEETASPTASIIPTITYIPYPDSTPLAKLLLTTDDILAPEVQDWDFVPGIYDSFLKEETVYVKDKSYDLKADCLIECTKQIWGTSRRYLEIMMIRAQDEQEASFKAEELFHSLNPYHYEYGIDEYKWINAPTQNTHIGFSKWNKGFVLTTSIGTIALMIVSYPSPYSDGRIASRKMLLWEASLHQEKCYFPIGEKAYWRSNMMSLKSKRELLAVVRTRYLKANKAEKQKMLDEFTLVTGYHRKHAIRILKNQIQVQNRFKRKPKTYKVMYRGEVVQALEQIWEIYGHLCSKRLQPFLPEAIQVLERCQEIELCKDTKALLLKISSASIDRCLRPIRHKSLHGLSTTKPGSLLKKLVPVQTFTAWNKEQPGFMEIDLVAHCGASTEGQYLNTLTCTDICSGWTDVTALSHRSQQVVATAIHQMRQRLPFALLGIDSDNGSEFINDLLYRYCQDEKITFTRSRPYQKNDQAHVEQKNWSVVRHIVGYDRWETAQELALLESIYDDLRLYINFFQPSLKLIAKERIGNQTIKRYDPAKTPYQRVLERKDISLPAKARLMNSYLQLNPVELRCRIDQKTAKLWKISR